MDHISIANDMIELAPAFGFSLVLLLLLSRGRELTDWICAKAQQVRCKTKRFLQNEFFLFLNDEWRRSEDNILLPPYLRRRIDHSHIIQKEKTMKTKLVSIKHICPECGFKLTSDVNVYTEIVASALVVSFVRDCPNCKIHLDIVSIECLLKDT